MTTDDFFRYATECREWLWSRKGIHTSSLTTDAARDMFSDFVVAWNKGKLSSRYYAGIEPTSVASSSRTDYKWSFSGVDSRQLDSIRNTVNRATSAGRSTSIDDNLDDELLDAYGPVPGAPAKIVGTAALRPNPSDIIDREREREQRDLEYQREKKDRHDYRRSQRDSERDLAPRATGRERIQEKRREENSARRSHEASRREDFAIDPYDDSERQSTMDHHRRQERAEERRREERAAVISDKAIAARSKEDQTMAQLRELARNAGHRV